MIKGLVIVHTGDGKGKTTAAMGLAVRAWGDGLRVLILQFIKGSWQTGEAKAIEALAKADGRIAMKSCGLGFTNKGNVSAEEHQRAAQETLKLAESEMLSGNYDMIILDEINYAVKFGLLSVDDVLHLLDVRPQNLHLVLTGRDACSELIERANLVTEMKLIKHPYQQGTKAQKGIEY